MSELETGALGPGRIEPRELEQEMRSSFLDYAMSVIVARALPDVRDGLKPVHRRVLYGMHEAGMQPNRPYKKCARIVGDVMGSYHPHGDAAIYDTLVRMAQPFSLRYPLVDGQGNFGNLDDDPPAAMRYTECRLSRMATEMLRDIDADTVDFQPNYDESRREPSVLPSRFPDLPLDGAAGLADHSDRSGMRIQIELKRDAVPQVALNKLFKHTPLQSTFGYNAVALVDGVPRTLSLLELVRHYLDYQREVVTRRSKYELRKAEERAHVLEGYLIALDNLDDVIALIRSAADTDEARTGLMERFSLSEIQAQAILDLRLARLTGLARKEIEGEYGDLRERIGELRGILGDPTRIDGLIREELLEVKQIYGRSDERRTEIVAAEEELELEDMIAEEDMVIAITRSGYIKRLPVTSYREQRRGGIGVMGMDLKDEDYIEHLFVASTHDYILFFTNVGKVYRLKVHELPLGSRQSKGRAIQNLLPFRQDEQVRAVIQTRDFAEAEHLVFGTKNGVVKKTKLATYNTPLKSDGIIAIKMREGDELVGVRHSTGDDDVMMVSRKGQAVRFHETDARPMGRDTSGVAGMKLRKDDEVISINIAEDDSDLLVVTENGFGKRTRVSEYPRKRRGGLGVRTVQLTEAKGQLVGSRVVRDGYQVMLISTYGTVIRMPVDGIRRVGRATPGV